MKRTIIFSICVIAVLTAMLAFSSCDKMDGPHGVSDEIYSLVQEIQPSSVIEYRYNSRKVYLFENIHVYDGYQYLYSRKGECLALYGGFYGNGDGRCPDFWDTAERLRTVYEEGQWLE
ncbi:MAG: hypothetical protein Q4G10_04615 [Bacteroidia bacterium]|nr:hypothetical protein [Bacteroidia bacterium]